MPLSDRGLPAGFTPARASHRSPLIHLALTDATVTLCGRLIRILDGDPDGPRCQRCAHQAALRPQDRDPAGYRLTVTAAAGPGPGGVRVTDPAGALLTVAASLPAGRDHAWRHAHHTARATARLRRRGVRHRPGDLDGWRVLLPRPASGGRAYRAGTIRASDAFLADLDEGDQPPRRFTTRAHAVRWIVAYRVVHGWPAPGWLVLDETTVLRRTASRRAAARWLTHYTGQRATRVYPIDIDTYEHRYPEGGYLVVRASRAHRLGVDPHTRARYPYDELPLDRGTE
jgi:hypothetical protein